MLVLLLTILVLAITGCPEILPKTRSGSCATSQRLSPVYTGKAEIGYCTTPIVYASPSTVSGVAEYESRSLASLATLGDVLPAKPIRQAEVRVLNGAGTVVQCSSTDDSGAFSFDLPQDSGTYTVEVNSRGYNSEARASVLNCPEEQKFYSLTTTVITNSATENTGTLTALVADMTAAPFNIFDQIVTSNKFLRTQVGTCPFTGCTDFTVAPKVSAYWVEGYNPNEYFGSSGGLSFYLPGYSRLFILGGSSGNIADSDTDHWDNSVIIHEYGHFLEDVFTKSDSPGGSHSGNRQIDPRLAWGEGWGNFIQAAVLNDPRYVDTAGIDHGTKASRSFIFEIPLEAPDGLCGSFSGCDIPTMTSEGQFREFAVTRWLWDVFDDATEGGGIDVVDSDFPEIWAMMVASNGLPNTSAAFRDIGLLHDVHVTDDNTEFTDWSALRADSNHLHGPDRREYAYYVEPDGVTCNTARNFTIDPIDDPNDSGSFSTSNLLRNNDFFHFKHAGGPLTLTLNYLNQNTIDVEPDLDLYLYNESARLGVSADWAGYSDQYYDNDANTEDQEQIVLSTLAAGDYLINVKMYTGPIATATGNSLGIACPPAPATCRVPAGEITDFEILANGVRLCPATLP